MKTVNEVNARGCKPSIKTRCPQLAKLARKVFGKTAIVVKLPAFRL